MAPLQAAYEQVFYPSFPRANSAPDRLAAVATLFGLTPPVVATARVLEIGCSDGGNLLPAAMAAPEGKFLGIDYSRPAIARGRERIRDLELTNIELRELDVMAFPEDTGPFDYIIAHGVFSWVPPPAREQVLAIAQRHLAPAGVAYIDYNARPGGQLRYLFREAMQFHVARFSDPAQQIEQARSLLKLIIDAGAGSQLYRSLAETELRRLIHTPNAVLFHDDVSGVNDTLSFTEFMAAAAKHDLQFLGEADVSTMSGLDLPAAAREHLGRLGDILQREQYLDILEGRSFRQTLLCRSSQTLDRHGSARALAGLRFSSAAVPRGEVDGEGAFEMGRRGLKTSNPLTKAVMHTLLSAAPASIPWSELIAETERALPELPDAAGQLLPMLLHMIAAGAVTIHAHPATFSVVVAEKPMASPLARYQASRGEPITTLAHRLLEPDDDALRRLLPWLDGTRTVAELAAELGVDQSAIEEQLHQAAASALLMRE